MRRGSAIVLSVLLSGVLAAPAARAQKPGAPDQFTPRPAPTVELPKLTPRSAPGKDAPQPREALLPLPVVAPPLSPVLVPGQAPAALPMPVPVPALESRKPEPAPAPAVEPPALAAAPLPARKPERVAETALAKRPPAVPSATSFKGYAKASREDRGCALPDDMPEKRRPPAIAVGATARVLADANLRVAPFCDAKVADVLEDGETVTVLGAHGAWYQVGRRGRPLGYVGAALLAETKRR